MELVRAEIGTLGLAGIVVALGLLACLVMWIAFQRARRKGRWQQK